LETGPARVTVERVPELDVDESEGDGVGVSAESLDEDVEVADG